MVADLGNSSWTRTKGLTGRLQEPVSLVFVGTQAQPFGLNAVLGEAEAALGQRGDPAGPVTPSFLAEEPNALAFNQPIGVTLAQRHHIRISSTSFQTRNGWSIRLATASFDR
jgi:hypothetical protein